MKKTFLPAIALCLTAASLLLASCNNDGAKTTAAASGFSLDSVKAAIAASNKIYVNCFATGDSVTFVNSYTADACINPPNAGRICGTQGISAFFNGAAKMGIHGLKLNTEDVMGSESLVSEVGNYELMGDKDAIIDKGKFIVLWKNDNGKWKMHRDIWNSNNPPMPPAPAEKK